MNIQFIWFFIHPLKCIQPTHKSLFSIGFRIQDDALEDHGGVRIKTEVPESIPGLDLTVINIYADGDFDDGKNAALWCSFHSFNCFLSSGENTVASEMDILLSGVVRNVSLGSTGVHGPTSGHSST